MKTYPGQRLAREGEYVIHTVKHTSQEGEPVVFFCNEKEAPDNLRGEFQVPNPKSCPSCEKAVYLVFK